MALQVIMETAPALPKTAAAFPKAKGAKIMPNDDVCSVFPGGVARKTP